MMKEPDPTKGAIQLRLLSGFLILFALPWMVFGSDPNWWHKGNNPPVISGGANDYAAVNQGQVKNIATAAYEELQANLPDGAGDSVTALINQWSVAPASGTGARILVTGTQTNDYAAVNLGQLKAVAKPFFDKLLEIGYQGHPLESGTYPWIGCSANDYGMANIGQVKNLFSFDLSLDNDHNGLPDNWEIRYLGHAGADPNGDPDGDGLTNLQEYTLGSDPMDFGNRNGDSVDSDGNGIADWWEILYFGTLGNNPNQGLANKGGLTLKEIFDNDLDLTESSTVLDGIPDAWKIQHGLDPLNPNLANEDSDGDGLTDEDEYNAGTDPMAWDSDGDNIGDGNDAYPMVVNPSSPENLRVTVPSWDEQYKSSEPDWSAVDYTSIELKWDASPNGASRYKIERREDNDLWHEIATISDTSYPETGLVANRNYQYRIWAIKNAGGSEIGSTSITASYQVPLALRMHAKTASVLQHKQGHPEFTTSSTPGTPRKFYLSRNDVSSCTGSKSWGNSNSGGASSQIGDYSYTSVYTPKLKKWTYSGSYSYYHSYSSFSDSDYSSSSEAGSSNYDAIEQSRNRTSVNAITQRSTYGQRSSSYYSYSGSSSGSSSSSSQESGNYLLQGAYIPTEGGGTVGRVRLRHDQGLNCLFW